MRTLKIFALIFLIWGYPANLLADEFAGFSVSSARQLIVKHKSLLEETAFQGREIVLLKERGVALTLANDDLVRLNVTYEGMVADLGGSVEMLKGDVIICNKRGDQWKLEAIKCGENLTACRNVPWYKSKTLWMPLSFVAGVYVGASAR